MTERDETTRLRVRFKRDNSVRFGQDFRWFVGVPVGVWFDAHSQSGHWRLVAPGFGGVPYGNGALYVSKHEVHA